MGIVQIVLSLIVGCIVGLLARSVVPGVALLGLPIAAACGAFGAVIGGVLGSQIWRSKRRGINPVSFSLSLVGAVLLLFVGQRFSHRPAPTLSPEQEERAALALRSSLLPDGEQPEAVIILQKNEQGAMAPVLLGKLHTVPVEEGDQAVEKPDPLHAGNIVIVRDLDEETTKDLRVTNGTLQVAGAYISRQNHELEYLGQVDLNKRNKRLAVEFGIQGEKPTPTPK